MKKKILIVILILAALVVAFFSGRLSSNGERNRNVQSESDEEESVVSKQSPKNDDTSAIADSGGTVNAELSQEEEISEALTQETDDKEDSLDITISGEEFDKSSISPYFDAPYEEVNDNKPFFLGSINISSAFDTTAEEFVYYSELDDLGRCGQAYANVCSANLPTEPREEIGSIKPSGWQTVKYPDVIEDLYLYNRCHLIGYQLGGGSANERNLITGTRYMNVEGMLPFENQIKEYVTRTQNHVLYRVTPIFNGNNLVADGVLMEAYSAEDCGEGICFCVYAYNVQPGIEIDYATGDSREMSPEELSQTNYVKVTGVDNQDESNDSARGSEKSSSSVADVENVKEISDEDKSDRTDYNFDTYDNQEQQQTTDHWVLNAKTRRIHKPTCDSVPKIAPQNYDTSNEGIEELEAKGYKKCGQCFK